MTINAPAAAPAVPQENDEMATFKSAVKNLKKAAESGKADRLAKACGDLCHCTCEVVPTKSKDKMGKAAECPPEEVQECIDCLEENEGQFTKTGGPLGPIWQALGPVLIQFAVDFLRKWMEANKSESDEE